MQKGGEERRGWEKNTVAGREGLAGRCWEELLRAEKGLTGRN